MSCTMLNPGVKERRKKRARMTIDLARQDGKSFRNIAGLRKILEEETVNEDLGRDYYNCITNDELFELLISVTDAAPSRGGQPPPTPSVESASSPDRNGFAAQGAPDEERCPNFDPSDDSSVYDIRLRCHTAQQYCVARARDWRGRRSFIMDSILKKPNPKYVEDPDRPGTILLDWINLSHMNTQGANKTTRFYIRTPQEMTHENTAYEVVLGSQHNVDEDAEMEEMSSEPAISETSHGYSTHSLPDNMEVVNHASNGFMHSAFSSAIGPSVLTPEAQIEAIGHAVGHAVRIAVTEGIQHRAAPGNPHMQEYNQPRIRRSEYDDTPRGGFMPHAPDPPSKRRYDSPSRNDGSSKRPRPHVVPRQGG